MMLLSSFILIFLSFSYLSLSLPRHYAQVTNNRTYLVKKHKQLLALVGYTLLLASIFFLIYLRGATLGSVYWCAIASVDALILSMVLSYKAKWLRFILL